MRNDKIKVKNIRLASVVYWDKSRGTWTTPKVHAYTYFVNVGGKWLNAFRPFNECNVRIIENKFTLVNGKDENGLCYILNPPLKELYGHEDEISFGKLCDMMLQDYSYFFFDRKEVADINNDIACLSEQISLLLEETSKRRAFKKYIKAMQAECGEKVKVPKLKCLNNELTTFENCVLAKVCYLDSGSSIPAYSDEKPIAKFCKVGDKWINMFHPLVNCNVYLEKVTGRFEGEERIEYELVNGQKEEGVCYVIPEQRRIDEVATLLDEAMDALYFTSRFYIDRWDLCFVDKGMASTYNRISALGHDQVRRDNYKDFIRSRKQYSPNNDNDKR